MFFCKKLIFVNDWSSHSFCHLLYLHKTKSKMFKKQIDFINRCDEMSRNSKDLTKWLSNPFLHMFDCMDWASGCINKKIKTYTKFFEESDKFHDTCMFTLFRNLSVLIKDNPYVHDVAFNSIISDFIKKGKLFDRNGCAGLHGHRHHVMLPIDPNVVRQSHDVYGSVCVSEQYDAYALCITWFALKNPIVWGRFMRYVKGDHDYQADIMAQFITDRCPPNIPVVAEIQFRGAREKLLPTLFPVMPMSCATRSQMDSWSPYMDNLTLATKPKYEYVS